ncbi:ABC transporter substrate-binding protein [Pelagibacterium limicola]|uniref:ABC transporter substrate-binding protein n=1 Tax=Pelagibacterium limicola TaxID=2791022 RepID=UPI0018AFAB15|nr:extracellular solute-binding protein [Pelagibacterium limicola]
MNDKITRRHLLKTSSAAGIGLVAAGTGLRAFGQDNAEMELPVGAKGKLTVIHRTEYFEAAQNIFRETVTQFASAKGVELDISTTNAEAFGDFLGKMTAAVRAGNPPDLAYTSNVSIQQMAVLDIVEDVTDVVEEAISRYGRVMPGINAEKIGKINGKWYSIPFIANTTGTFFRGDKLREKGIDPQSLDTWQKRVDAALAISDPDNEFWGWGNTVNQSGDGWGIASGIFNAFGGHFTDASGLKVTFYSPETVAALEFIKKIYDRNGEYAAMLPPGVESWGDISNNEAWLAGNIGYTHNAFSLYAAGKRDNNPVFPNTVLLRQPSLNDGTSTDGGQVGGWLTIFKGAPNLALAKELALDLLNPDNFTPMSSVAGGLLMPAYENLWTDELIAADPNFAIIKEQVSVEDPWIGASWPADPNPLIDSIRPQGILEQAMGNVISGRMSPDEAAQDAHQKIVDLFEEGGAMQ